MTPNDRASNKECIWKGEASILLPSYAFRRTSENSVNAKFNFAEFPFHALRCILSHSNNPRRVRRGYANERGTWRTPLQCLKDEHRDEQPILWKIHTIEDIDEPTNQVVFVTQVGAAKIGSSCVGFAEDDLLLPSLRTFVPRVWWLL
jgi:hypothetical protein